MSFCCNVLCAHQSFQFFKEERMPGSVQMPGGRQLLFCVFQIQDHRHIAVKDAQQIDHLGILRAAAGRQTDIQPLCRRLDRVRAAVLRAGRVVAVNGHDAVRQQLGSFVLPHRQASVDDHDRIFADMKRTF